ncbi:pyridoxamine 5'-phosphate oxidase family protein [Aquimarina gracilis]|uniref:Pyridoxamine 5'-phosphate oxidase family protein n=1 Tax=Aquimarina gracilis TaxID=874422 RepID=A0ABU5ZVU1_9FLAO|nr:pyridoxamine 5'-phosphate oxidase family protein [Aquimarina gracilis]MEB3345968.1 pyridoxamine 5'-phosphate oxidase family protein [Aquimarina gracilis]
MSTKNYYKENAKVKLKEIIENIGFAMMATRLGNKPLHIIPMYTKKVDPDGNIWFLSKKDSDHFQNIKIDNDVQLIYSEPKSAKYLSLSGRASTTEDSEIINDLYSNLDNNWFEGPEDPLITAICIEPVKAYYWDTKTNKFIDFMKMEINTYLGTNMDVGEKGKLEI